jgi:hypothetical protein
VYNQLKTGESGVLSQTHDLVPEMSFPITHLDGKIHSNEGKVIAGAIESTITYQAEIG